MINAELLQRAAKNVSKLIRLEDAWRAGQYVIEDEVIEFDVGTRQRLKIRFAQIRQQVIDDLNSITP